MINRNNYQLVQKYLEYREKTDQLADKSLRLEVCWLRLLLEWAQDVPFAKASRIEPAYSVYVLRTRRDGKDHPYSKNYSDRCVRAAKRFFEWLSRHVAGHRTLNDAYLDTLKPPKINEPPKWHEAVNIDEVRAMAQADVINMRERRIRAAVVFLFLSGMRIGAFTTLSLEAVDIDNRTVKQWPSLGVKTKGGKYATTYLLPIDDLLDVVKAWDVFVRDRLKPSDRWYPNLRPMTGELDTSDREPGEQRDVGFRADLREWLCRVGLEYHSPHKFRHGHAVYSLIHAKDVSDLKAISLNMMHSSIVVTDSIYAVLSEQDIQARINALREGRAAIDENQDILATLKALIDQLEGGKNVQF
ncbi:MAG: site-specific integrase [Anaerolineae bacterium]|nr:site-specific integrase [Anaerolineae bacterium]